MITMSTEDLAARGAAATWPEIAQQPEVWREVAQVVQQEGAAVRRFLDPLLAQQHAAVVATGANNWSWATISSAAWPNSRWFPASVSPPNCFASVCMP